MVENHRYIGEVYIDPDTDELFQSFMHNILNVYSGTGRGFDADMLDGMHWDGDNGIKKYIDDRTPPIDISKYITTINIATTNDNNEQNKTFSADKNTVDLLLDANDITVEDDRPNPENLPTIKNVQDALGLLWSDLNDVANSRQAILDQVDTIESNLQSTINGFQGDIEDFQKVICTDDQGNTYINADRINNIRIIPVTQSIYDSLDGADPGTDDYEYFNDPRNLFIISEKAEFDNTVDTGLHYSLKEGYDFRIENGMLQYKHVYTNAWHDVADINDLLNFTENNSQLTEIITNSIHNIIENDANVAYNSNALTDALNGIDLGYIYNIKYNGNNLDKNKDTNTSSTYIDLKATLDDVLSPLNGSISEINQEISDIKTKMTQIRTDITQIQTQISNLPTSDNMNAAITQSNNNLTNYINKLYTDPNNWIIKTFTSSNWKNNHGASTLKYNPKLHICIASIRTTHKHVTANNNQAVNRNGSSTISYLPDSIKPTTTVWIPITAYKYVILNSDGSIQFYCTSYVSSGESSITNHSTFFYQ